MTTRRAFLCVVMVGSLVLPVVVHGQTSRSALAGVVRDTTGAVLPGVTVEAASPALIKRVRSVAADSSGVYRIVDLRPGIYTITFTLPGFNTVRVQNFELRADFTATVNAEMSVGELAETISVTGEAPLVDVQSTTRSAVYNQEALENLPNNRQIQSLAQTIPGVVGGMNIDGPASRSLSVHGSRIAETNSAIDGMSDRRGACRSIESSTATRKSSSGIVGSTRTARSIRTRFRNSVPLASRHEPQRLRARRPGPSSLC